MGSLIFLTVQIANDKTIIVTNVYSDGIPVSKHTSGNLLIKCNSARGKEWRKGLD